LAARPASLQYVWGLRNLDDLVLRDDNSTGGDLGINGSGLGRRLYALQDANWNVVALVDAGGTVVERYTYTAYGTATVRNADFSLKSGGTAFAWTRLFAAMDVDAATSLDYDNARWYNPSLGVFTSADPIAADANTYRYCLDNPITNTDPTGEMYHIEWRWDPNRNDFVDPRTGMTRTQWNAWNNARLAALRAAAQARADRALAATRQGYLRQLGGMFEVAAGCALLGLSGIAEVGSFGALTPAAVGVAALGVAVGAHGLDTINAGSTQAVTGTYQRTDFSQAMEEATGNREQAEDFDRGMAMYGPMLGAVAMASPAAGAAEGEAASAPGEIEKDFLLRPWDAEPPLGPGESTPSFSNSQILPSDVTPPFLPSDVTPPFGPTPPPPPINPGETPFPALSPWQ
jgi:RHS repeat-associated protein